MAERGPQVGSAHVKIYPEVQRANLDKMLRGVEADLKAQAARVNNAWASVTRQGLEDVKRNLRAQQDAESRARFARLAEERKAQSELAKMRARAAADERRDIQRRINELSKWYDAQKKAGVASDRETAKIKAELDDTAARIALARLKKEADFTAHVKVEVERDRLRELINEFGTLKHSVRQLDRAIPAPFASLAIVVAAALPLLIPLVASIGAAAAAAFAAIPAFVGLGAAIASLQGAFSGPLAALKAYSAMQESAASSAATSLARQHAVANARQALADAEAAGADRIRRAQENLNRARREALQDLEDLIWAQRTAVLDQEAAQLRLEEAQQRLNEVNADATTTDLERRRAILDVKQAQLDLAMTNDKAKHIEADLAEAQRKGVEGSDKVVDAKRELADAQRDAAKSIDQARRALELASQRMETGSAAASKFNQAMAQLSPTGRKFAEQLIGMKEAWDDFKKEIETATLPGFIKFFNDVQIYVPLAKKTILDFGSQISQTASDLGDLAKTPLFQGQMKTMAEGASTAFGELRSAVVPLTGALASLGEAATPVLINLAHWIGENVKEFSNWIEAKRQTGELQEFFNKSWQELEKWLNIAKNFGVGIFNVLKAALPVGEQFSTSIEKISEKFREWTETNTDDIEEFFEKLKQVPWLDILKTVGVLAAMIGALGILNKSTGAIKGLLEFFKIIAAGGVGATLGIVAGSILLIAGALTVLYLNSENARKAINDLLKGFGKGFKDVWDNVLKPIFSQIEKAWDDAVGSMTSILNDLGLTWEDVGRIIGTVLGIIIAVLLGPFLAAAKLGALYWGYVAWAIGKFREAWDKAWPHIKNAIDKEVVPLFNKAKDKAIELKDKFVEFYNEAKPKFIEFAGEVKRAWNEDIKPALEELKTKAGEMWSELKKKWDEEGKPALEELKKKWDEDLKPALDDLKDALEEIWPYLKGILTLLAALGGASILGSIKGLATVLQGVSLGLSLVTNQIGATASLFGFLWDTTEGSRWALTELGKLLAGSVKTQVENFFGALNWAWEKIKNINWPDIGNAILDGVFGPLGGLAQKIEQWVKDHIWKPITDLLGIHSPSEWAKDRGKDVIDGFINGLLAQPNAIIDAFKKLWPDDLGGFFGGVKDKIGDFFGGLGSKAGSIKAPDLTPIENAFRSMKDKVKGFLQEIPDKANEIGGWFKNTLPNILGSAFDGLKGIFKDLGQFGSDRWEDIKTKAGQVKDWFQSTLRPHLGTIFTALGGVFTTLWNTAKDKWEAIKTKVNDVKNFFQTQIVTAYNTIKTNLVNTFNDIWANFKKNFESIYNKAVDIKNKLAATWEAVKKTLHAAFNQLAGLAATAINKFINVVNDVINKINKILPKELHLKTIGGVSVSGSAPSTSRSDTTGGVRSGAGRLTRASGGPVWGSGGPRTDSVMGEKYGIPNTDLSRSEHIISYNEVKGFGGHYALAQMRRLARAGVWQKIVKDGDFTSRTGLANGGPTRRSLVDGGASGLGRLAKRAASYAPTNDGDKGSWRTLATLGRLLGAGNLTSGYRPGSRVASGFDWHASGQAADLGGYNQDAAASAFQNRYGGALLELIHSTNRANYGIKRGQIHNMGSQLWAEHKNHIHVAAEPNMAVQMLNHEKRNRRAVFRAPGAGDGYIGNPLMEKALALFNKHLPRINALIPKGGDILGNVLKGPFTAVRDNIQNELSSGALGAAVGALGGGALGAVVREAMKITGVDDSWFGPLLTLIQRESGGNPNAINNWDINAKNGDPSRGLMQTIGATFRRYKLPGLSNNIFDPLSNVVAGIRYIKARYGSIFNVQQAVGATPKGYDNGGPLPPGGLAYNASTGVEMVLNRAQGLALERRLDADDRPIELTANLHLDGKVIDQRIIRYDKNQVKDLRRGVRP